MKVCERDAATRSIKRQVTVFPSWYRRGGRGGQFGETFRVSDHPEGVNQLQGRGVPLLGEEGWLRRKEDAAKPPY